ncbi:sporulation transcription regulator whiA [Mycobacterium tuberculosis]|nr:sporulation transcription regulator whiA [Mycobacterium tuberculosis]CNU98283.1 sporulation transcription regulator whiA [Mycobacterium tuberculosis]CNV08103.1 sporulation transcription regulator whiA [Mycobacterium tuberculosis]
MRATANRLANFDDANLRRSARAAVAAAARVERALEILGDTVPEHLASAGKLRVEHRQASLEELGRLADPPMTKDAVAGRIRRLLSMADRKAKVDGIPDTESVVTPDLLEDA